MGQWDYRTMGLEDKRGGGSLSAQFSTLKYQLAFWLSFRFLRVQLSTKRKPKCESQVPPSSRSASDTRGAMVILPLTACAALPEAPSSQGPPYAHSPILSHSPTLSHSHAITSSRGPAGGPTVLKKPGLRCGIRGCNLSGNQEAEYGSSRHVMDVKSPRDGFALFILTQNLWPRPAPTSTRLRCARKVSPARWRNRKRQDVHSKGMTRAVQDQHDGLRFRSPGLDERALIWHIHQVSVPRF